MHTFIKCSRAGFRRLPALSVSIVGLLTGCLDVPPAGPHEEHAEQAVHTSNYLTHYHPFGIGDFDGDGIDEMLARHLPTDPDVPGGQLYLVGYDGFTGQRVETLLGNAGPLPVIPTDQGVVIGDVDGDGRDEVLVYGPSGVQRGELDLRTWDLSWDTLGGTGTIFPADWNGDGALDLLTLDGAAWKLGTWNGVSMTWASRGAEAMALASTGFRHWQILIKGKPRLLVYRNSDTRLFVGTLGTSMVWTDIGPPPYGTLNTRSTTEGSSFAISWGDYRDGSSGVIDLWSADVWKTGASAQTVDFDGDNTTEIFFLTSTRKNDDLAQSRWVAWSFDESGGVPVVNKLSETFISTDKDDAIEKYFFFETGNYKTNHKFFRGRFLDSKAESILEYESFPTADTPYPAGRTFLWRLIVLDDGRRKIDRTLAPSVSLAGPRVYAAGIELGGPFGGKQALVNTVRYEWDGDAGAFQVLPESPTSGDYDTDTAHERAGTAQNSSPVPIENQFGIQIYQRGNGGTLLRQDAPALWNPVAGAAGTTILSKPAGVYYDFRDRLFALVAGGQIVAIDGASSPEPQLVIAGPPPGAASAPAVRVMGTPYWKGASTAIGLELYVRGSDNKIWRKKLYWCTTCGSAWDLSSPWELIGGNVTRDPTVAEMPDGSIHVFARGPSGSLVHGRASSFSAPFVWSDNPTLMASSPVALVTPDGADLNVFFALAVNDVVCSARVAVDGSISKKCFPGDIKTKSDPGVLYFGRDPDSSGNPLFYRVGIWTTMPSSPNNVFARDDFQIGTLGLSVPHFGWYVRQLVRLSQLTLPPPIEDGYTEAHYVITVGEGDTSSSSNEATPSCAWSSAPERALRFRIDVPSRVTANTIGSSFDTVLYLVPAGQSAQQVACNDDSLGSLASSIDVTLPPGDYDVIVDGYGTSAGRASLELVLERLPSTNDTASTATWLAPSNRGDTRDLHDDFAGACGGSGALDATHTLSLSSPALVTLSAGGTDFDTVVSVRAGSTETVCNDDGDTGASFIEAVMQPGTYTVVLDGASPSDAGRYLLTSEVGAVPASDRLFAPRTIWRDGTFAGTTNGFVNDLAGSCAPSAGGDAVFALSLEERGHVFLNTARSRYDTVLHVRRASDLAELACNDDANGGLQSSVELDLEAGDYYVVVDGYAGQTGSFSLQVHRDTAR
jgi:hypothetical protein